MLNNLLLPERKVFQMLNKKKYWNCKNCNCQEKVRFKNKVLFCFGLVKKPYCKEDYYRFCIIKGKNRNANDIMEEEVQTMLMGLSSILFHKRLKEINKKCSKKS
jgi:hypothetical protein